MTGGSASEATCHHLIVECTTVLFDLDGTLIDSQEAIVASYRHALSAFGLKARAAAIKGWIGPPLEEGLAALGVPPGGLAAATAVYRDHFAEVGVDESELFDGVPQMLDALTSAGVRLGLTTSKLQTFAESILVRLGIREGFAAVAGTSLDGSRSSKEEVVADALEALGRPHRPDVALVGDRGHDMLAATHHGIFPVGAAWGYGGRAELRRSGAAAVVETPSALTTLLLARATTCGVDGLPRRS